MAKLLEKGKTMLGKSDRDCKPETHGQHLHKLGWQDILLSQQIQSSKNKPCQLQDLCGIRTCAGGGKGKELSFGQP